MKKNVLLVSIAFSPNIGGIETHFDDLVKYLDKKGWNTKVLTYTPITTDVKASLIEHRTQNITIFRVPWFGGLFYKLIHSPALEFLYLIPGLFFMLPLMLLTVARKTMVIHSHGLAAGFVCVIWGRLFKKKVITTTHSIYHFPKSGLYRQLASWIFIHSDTILTISNQAKNEIENLGIPPEKITVFTYWVDQEIFRPLEKHIIKEQVDIQSKFNVLFVGRLIPEKGIHELLKAANMWNKKISLVIAGTGPLEEKIKSEAQKNHNIIFIGKINNQQLPTYYATADILIVPSTHEEGFGRVILEALSCGVPVIGSNRGAIPDVIDQTVGRLVDITSENIVQCVNYLYAHPSELRDLRKNASAFASKKYSQKNAEAIIRLYE